MKVFSINIKIVYVFLILFIAVGLLFVLNFENAKSVFIPQKKDLTVIVDAGHGGFDGGAVASNGVIEKDINLQIAKRLQKKLSDSGYTVVMTREEDIALASSKAQDIKARIALMKENPDALFISIHCNKFPDSSCNGLHAFYADNSNVDKAKAIAETIQGLFKEDLNPACHRVAKKADKTVYLMRNAVTTTVLVECGFLSNSKELSNLQDEEYQNKIADIILKSISENYEE